MKDKRIQVLVTTEQHDLIKQMAASEGRTLSNMAEQLLRWGIAGTKQGERYLKDTIARQKPGAKQQKLAGHLRPSGPRK